MKQSLSTRLTALFAAVVISSILLESVAELGRPVMSHQVHVARAAASTAPQL